MNKKTIITALLAFVTIAGYAGSNKITNRTDGSITFVVDENLTPFDNPFMRTNPKRCTAYYCYEFF